MTRSFFTPTEVARLGNRRAALLCSPLELHVREGTKASKGEKEKLSSLVRESNYPSPHRSIVNSKRRRPAKESIRVDIICRGRRRRGRRRRGRRRRRARSCWPPLSVVVLAVRQLTDSGDSLPLQPARQRLGRALLLGTRARLARFHLHLHLPRQALVKSALRLPHRLRRRRFRIRRDRPAFPFSVAPRPCPPPPGERGEELSRNYEGGNRRRGEESEREQGGRGGARRRRRALRSPSTIKCP